MVADGARRRCEVVAPLLVLDDALWLVDDGVVELDAPGDEATGVLVLALRELAGCLASVGRPAVDWVGHSAGSLMIGVRFSSTAEPASPFATWVIDAQLSCRKIGR